MKAITKFSKLITTHIFVLFILAGIAQPDRLYYGVEIDGVLCGYSTSDSRMATYQQMPALEVVDSVHLLLKALGQDLNADIISHYYINPENGKVIVSEAQYNTSDAGRVITTKTEIFENFAIHSQKESGITDTFQLDGGLIFDHPQTSPYLIRDFVDGGAESMTYKIFDYIRGRATEQTFTLEGKETINLAGKTINTLVFNVYNAEVGTNTRTWVDNENASTVQFEILNRRIFLTEPSVIKNIQTVDMDNNLFAKVDESIANFTELTYMRVKADIRSAGEYISAKDLSFPGQQFDGLVEQNHIQGVFEIAPVRYDGTNSPPFPADYSEVDDLKEYLEPELFIESDHPDIIAKAKEITAGASDSWDAAIRLSKWVGKEIAGAVPGGTSAINTLRIREGECGSHSRLLAAFCRAVGIPARLSIGCLYSPWYGGSFGQHAWTEVYMGEETGWIAVDATILEFDYVDAGHIKLGEQSSFQPNSMEILEYRIGDEEMFTGIPDEYKGIVGPYINPKNRDVLEALYLDGCLTVNIMGRMKLALHDADEEGRMYAKLTDKVYFTFQDDEMIVGEIAFALKNTDGAYTIEEDTPDELKPLIGPYMIFQLQAKFEVFWDEGLYMLVPDVEKARSLILTEEGRWKDTVDGKAYAFVYNGDGSVSGMNIFVTSVLEKGFTAGFMFDKTLQEHGLEAAGEKFLELWNNRALDLEYTEQDMNKQGYNYLNRGDIEEALMVFRLNVETFPESWNVYDSYGEALLKNGNIDQAILNYNKSLELNPNNENGKAMLETIKTEEGE